MKDRIFIVTDTHGFPDIHYEKVEGGVEYLSAEYAEQLKRLAKADVIDWAMRLCFTGSTPSMIRKALWNKWQELQGNVEEKA